MILWHLRGYTDLDGEFEGGEVECALERAEDGYRLLVAHDGEIQVHESHATIETARGRAELLTADLLTRGWLEGLWVRGRCRGKGARQRAGQSAAANPLTSDFPPAPIRRR